MPQFVVLTHDHPSWHWDFMLSTGEALRTWRLEVDPFTRGGGAATPLADHRLAYLAYEGPVSGGRGTVARWDAGNYECLVDEPERIEVRLTGGLLRGRLTLERAPGGGLWRFYFLPDAPAGGDQATR
ncbi:MAG TPA: DNA polymerase ligase N-terminal domain-containing protein [Planctomycetaceae bacterium]|nr:DNA polymerase ligase N-terminal domain-containing protein [Planctomycetaceae bacterium]